MESVRRLPDKLFASGFAMLARGLTGVRVRWPDSWYEVGKDYVEDRPRIYVANHTSHADFVLLWSVLPVHLRCRTRPVAAGDYWRGGLLRRYFGAKVFNAVLIDRVARDPNMTGADLGKAAVASMSEAIDNGSSLILFPEGTRGDGATLNEFRSGLYHLCIARPDAEIVPVYLDNLNRALPKGEFLPVPMLSRVIFGQPEPFDPDEPKGEFLARMRDNVQALNPVEDA
jgi:1-acyl-sn-glycerol-3-phosphate acyltransferase